MHLLRNNLYSNHGKPLNPPYPTCLGIALEGNILPREDGGSSHSQVLRERPGRGHCVRNCKQRPCSHTPGWHGAIHSVIQLAPSLSQAPQVAPGQ